MKAIIWGASGFIGTNLASKLSARGWDVTCVSRSRSRHWPDGVRVLKMDLHVPSEELLDAMKGACVFHLASSTRPSRETSRAVVELQQHVGTTLGYLERTRDLGCRWIFASSGGTVYGEPQTDRIAEDHPTRPISSYGAAKLALESYFHVYQSLHGTDYRVARIANPYGPFQMPGTGQGLIATLIHRIMHGEPVEIWGDGGNVRDYLHISDVTEALCRIATDGASGGIYNVGSGIGTSINELVSKVGDMLGKTPEIVRMQARGMDVRRNVLDIGKIGAELSWAPKVSLDSGLEDTYHWLLETGLKKPLTAKEQSFRRPETGKIV